ncbi:hypothetical protein ACEN2J_06280 [Pseudorhodobacter sp. W20_MBD10_FR17]|uniref:hypothetical protein n=1 Tax=Pseudorhodobacter sp. W20_MBD10_FR17 TaxID=3240266 RepID=UPI003F970ECA
MTKHLADHRSAPETARKKHFWAIEQRGDKDTPHPTIRALNQRPHDHNDGARVQQYLRIDRGVSA